MFASGPRELAVLDQASQILAEARTLEDVKSIRDKAEAARTYIRAAQLGLDLQNRAAELKLRAERKAGQFLDSLRLRGGDRKSKRHHVTLKLDDLGISKQQSKRWQMVATVSERDFAHYLRAAQEEQYEVTSAGLLRIARLNRVFGQKACACPAQAKPKATPDSASARSGELLEELRNHCQLLSDVLKPVYQDGSLDLKSGERRVVGRLLREMQDLLRDLHKSWSKQPPIR